jgi:sec-independent protein translocase protein TatB
MEILGIGPSELFFIIIIALIILGPKDMQKAGKTLGRWLNNFIRSDSWKALQETSREVRNIPTRLMREANMEIAETEKELNKLAGGQPTASPVPKLSRPQPAGNTTQGEPPSAKSIDPDSDTHDQNS